MIKSFTIEGFRKFESITFDGLGKINLFLGNNNAGKTTILEAIYAFTCGDNIQQLVSTSVQRHAGTYNVYSFMEKLVNVFNDRDFLPLRFSLSATMDDDSNKKIVHELHPEQIFADLEPTLMGSFGSNQSNEIWERNYPKYLGEWAIRYKSHDHDYTKRIKMPYPLRPRYLKEINPDMVYEQPMIRARFVDVVTHRNREENFKIYSFLKREKKGKNMAEFVAELSRSFVDIAGIDCIPYPDGEMGPISFMTQNDGMLPIYSFGEGMQRWYNILGGMIVYQDSIHCIEEVDATFHPQAQKQLASNLVRYAEKYNNQLFLTSHSQEFVDNLLETVYGNEEEVTEDHIRVITLWHNPKLNKVQVRVLTGKEAYDMRDDFQMELR